jgi:putative N6-adenine-specific DNA methylase
MSLPPLLPCFAATAIGLESLARDELTALGLLPGEIEPGGVPFSADAAGLATALLQLRTVARVTVRIGAFQARSFAELERHAAKVDWSSVVPRGSAIHFRVTSKKSRLYHQDAIAERLERSVLATVTGASAVRAASAAEEREADVTRIPEVQRIIVRLHRDQVTLSADASGALLHRRGWRQAVAKAPLRETLAAAMLEGIGWDGSVPLHDPFGGSGTIAIEAAQRARRMAPGRGRRFAAEGWPALPPSLFSMARHVATAAELPAAAVMISASDRDHGAVRAMQENAERAGVADDLTIDRATVTMLTPDDGNGWVVTNPPYGVRIGDGPDLRDLYATLGHVMRARRPGWRLALLSADPRLTGQLEMRLTPVWRSENGGLPVELMVDERERERKREGEKERKRERESSSRP